MNQLVDHQLRLDLLRVSNVAAPQPHLAVDVAVWGVPEEMQQDEQEAGKPVLRVSVPLVFKGLSLRFFDAAQFAALRRLGQILVPARPNAPGAIEAEAAEFLDFLIGQSPADRQSLYRDGTTRPGGPRP